MERSTLNDTAIPQLPVSLTFSRLGASSSSIFNCEPRWLNTIGDNSSVSYSETSCTSIDPQASSTLSRWNRCSPQIRFGAASRTPHYRMPRQNGDKNDSAMESLGPPCSLHDHTQTKFSEYPVHWSMHEFPTLNDLLGDLKATEHTFHQNIAGLLPPINLGSKPNGFHISSEEVAAARSSKESNSSSNFEVGAKSSARPWGSRSVAQQIAADPTGPAPKTSRTALGSNGILSQQPPRSPYNFSTSSKLRQQAGWPGAGERQPLNAKAECGRRTPLDFGRIQCKQLVTPVSKPQLRIKSSNSEESFEQAVRSPSSYEALMKHLPHLSI